MRTILKLTMRKENLEPKGNLYEISEAYLFSMLQSKYMLRFSIKDEEQCCITFPLFLTF